MLAHLGARLADLGAMLAHLGAMCWPILGLCWPILRLGWPSMGLCWPILSPMLALCWPILSPKIRKAAKSGKSTKHRKTRDILAAGGVAGRGGGPSLLRRGENRLRQGHGQEAPGRI